MASKLLWSMITYLFPKNCYEEIVVHFHIFHEECAPLVMSRFLGLAITAGSILVLVPQIIKIWTAKSGAGVSIISQFLNLIACTGTAGYSFAHTFVFSQWGDALFLAIQTVVIIILILLYSDRIIYGLLFLVSYGCVVGAIYFGMVPLHILTLLQAATIPITMTSRTIQIMENYRNQSTGQLSAISMFLMFGGAVARIFTSVQETGDRLVILAYTVAAIMNGLILAQIFIYWGKKPTKKTV